MATVIYWVVLKREIIITIKVFESTAVCLLLVCITTLNASEGEHLFNV